MGNSKFPEDYFKYDVKNVKKHLDSFVEDMKRGYNQQVRHVLEGFKKTPGMRVVHCGMGGSAIAAKIMQSYLFDEKIILESVSGYAIHGELKNTDLVILSSYSGNTEEELSCYRQARRIGCQLVIITSGGRLQEAAEGGRLPLIKLPQGYPPRAALPYMFFTLMRVLEETALISSRRDEVQETVDTMMKNSLEEFAINLSEKLYGKIPLIYASNHFYGVAYRWKTQINENAKAVAFSNSFPEMDHNELAGFEIKNGLFHAVMLTSSTDPSRMRKRMQLSKELMQQADVGVTELNVKGSVLTQIFTAILAGDLTSYFLALRYQVDPEPVNLIEQLKRQMGPFI